MSEVVNPMAKLKSLKGTIVRHFKRDLVDAETRKKIPKIYLYEIYDVAHSTDGTEDVVVYRALYGKKELYTRKYSEFMSLVDRQKYETAKQTFRFEVLTGTYNDKSGK